jgi:hypothetical protein
MTEFSSSRFWPALTSSISFPENRWAWIRKLLVGAETVGPRWKEKLEAGRERLPGFARDVLDGIVKHHRGGRSSRAG